MRDDKRETTYREKRALLYELEEIATKYGLRQFDKVAYDALVASVLKKDGSVALTVDWDIGDGRMIQADKIRARDGAGIALYEDGGAGVFVKDGGNVGIGTATPNSKVQIVGGLLHIGNSTNLLGTGESFEVSPASGNASYLMNRPTVGDYVSTDWVTGGDIFTGWSMQMPPNQTYLQFIDRVNNLARMVLTDTGNVGIGTTIPAIKLEVRSDGTGAWGGCMGLSNATIDKRVFFGTYSNVAGVFAHNFALGDWADLYINNVNGTNGIVVKAAGNVGIGTSTPSAKLAINGGLAVGEDADPGDNNLKVVGNAEIDGALNHDGTTIGFYGVVPAIRAAHIVDADGSLADITTKFNTLLVALENIGILNTA